MNSNDINQSLFINNNPMCGVIKDSLQYTRDYFVVDFNKLLYIEERHYCTRIRVGKNDNYGKRWLMYK